MTDINYETEFSIDVEENEDGTWDWDIYILDEVRIHTSVWKRVVPFRSRIVVWKPSSPLRKAKTEDEALQMAADAIGNILEMHGVENPHFTLEKEDDDE